MSTLASLVSELRNIRKGPGLTAAKISKSPALCAALDGMSYEEMVKELELLTRALRPELKASALSSAYGFGMKEPNTLTYRRSTFASINSLSVDTAENYENEMIDELAAQVASGKRSSVPPCILYVHAEVINNYVHSVKAYRMLSAGLEYSEPTDTDLAYVVGEFERFLEQGDAHVELADRKDKMGQSSATLPAVIYQRPLDINPLFVVLDVEWLFATLPPDYMLACSASTLTEVMFLTNATMANRHLDSRVKEDHVNTIVREFFVGGGPYFVVAWPHPRQQDTPKRADYRPGPSRQPQQPDGCRLSEQGALGTDDAS